ncbi:MAG TPA: 16S rRNA (cytidine(1402)-2'-O)-methyltransferase [Mycobacteriales bacterium]|nr:16S rRNA (cytidine(1402)-2'-O)-methyltransferase [Mycobacteriales bacterium]
MTSAAVPAGTLVLCGAPIGNPDDASPRLAEVLVEADLVAVEDTRRLARLARHLGVRTAPMVSFFEGNESARLPELLAALRAGRRVALVTDAGMPSISDPGYRLVAAAVAEGIAVTVVPGPSAVTAALAVSGLATDRWCMEGFLPRQAGPRRTRLTELAGERRTLVLFEAPHRLAAALADLAAAFGGDRAAVVCRELTKTWEQVRRGSLTELAEWAAAGVRGEVTLVIAGAPASAAAAADPTALADAVAEREAAGEPRKDAIAAVAAAAGVPKRAVYDAVVAAKQSAR